mmetsp:Transcript_17565/g.68130  ORF Transcript_17565/g.68130 Transcript_17565/m.68130 type:complete len:463 (-) Transcript_17565:81-1469(-)
MGSSLSVVQEGVREEHYTLEEAKDRVVQELKQKIGCDTSLELDIEEQASKEGCSMVFSSGEDLAASLENDWFAVKLTSSDLDEEWLLVEYKASPGDDGEYELDSSDEEDEGENDGIDIPDYSRDEQQFKGEHPPHEGVGKSQSWFASALSLMSSISLPSKARVAEPPVAEEEESDLAAMRRTMQRMEAKIQSLEDESERMRSSLSGSRILSAPPMAAMPPMPAGLPAHGESDVTFEASPSAAPPPPPPPMPESGKLPVKRNVTVTKAVVRKKRTRENVRQDLRNLITRSDLSPCNHETAYSNFLECFRNDKKLRKLDRLVRLYGDLVKSLPTKPKSCFLKMCLWEKELFSKLPEKDARKWRASKMKKIIELESRDEVMAEVSLVEKALEYERKQAKINAATKNAGKARNSMMLELSGLLNLKQDAEAREKAQAELAAMEKTPIDTEVLEHGLLLDASTVVKI